MNARRGLAVLAGMAFISGCGFHFAGREGGFPPAFATLHVTVDGSPLRDSPLLKDLQRAVVENGGHLSDAAGVPVLAVSGETLSPQVLAVGNNGLVAAYLLDYSLQYEVRDPSGRPEIPWRSVKLQRTYQFSTFNVLGEEREQDYLQEQMRQAAIRQILRVLMMRKRS